MNCMNAAVANPATTNKIGSAPSRRSSKERGKGTYLLPPVSLLEGQRLGLICKELERVFECRHSEYIEARSAPYYRVSTERAAHKNVDKERAKSDLEEHRLVCVSAAKVRPVWARGPDQN
jgi:hypothetical protein